MTTLSAHAVVAQPFLGQLSGDAPEELVRQEADAATRAIQLDSLNTDALLTLADMSFKLRWDFAGADQQYRRAITIAPNAALAHIEYAKFLQNLDMSDSA